MSDIVLVKIGGSTLGSHDTTVDDIVELHNRGFWPVVVHGGGALISDWLKRLEVPTRFERGLRVTEEDSLDVVVAVLAGLVNKQIVASLEARGAPAVGLSGADGAMLHCRLVDEKLGFVGEVDSVDPGALVRVFLAGSIPVIAPIGLLCEGDKPTGQLLNTNADTAAGAVAIALRAKWLVFLSDVPGVKGADGETLSALSGDLARELIASGTIEGGMIPKVEACLAAASAAGCRSVVVDGRKEHVLMGVVEGATDGTVVG